MMSCPSRVAFINKKIRTAVLGSQLYGKAPVSDPIDALIEVHVAGCTINKDIFLTIMLWHVRAAHLQFLLASERDIAA